MSPGVVRTRRRDATLAARGSAPRPLTARDVRRILDDWGGLVREDAPARAGARPVAAAGSAPAPGRLAVRLLHGFPVENVLGRLQRLGAVRISTGPGPAPGLTQVEGAVDRLRGWQRWVLRVDELVAELPVIAQLCLYAHYVGRQDADAIAGLLGTSRRTVFEQRQRAEERLCAALNGPGPGPGPGSGPASGSGSARGPERLAGA